MLGPMTVTAVAIAVTSSYELPPVLIVVDPVFIRGRAG